MQFDQLLSTLDLVLPERSAAFISGPVFSGRRHFLQPEMDKAGVWEANARDMKDFATKLRNNIGRSVICPGHFNVAGWRGADYREFFAAVIFRYAAEVWFLDDWQFSIGSLEEFGLCQKLRIPRYDSHGRPLAYNTGLHLAEQALHEIRIRGGSADRLESIVARLRLAS